MASAADSTSIAFSLDGETIRALPGETLLTAAKRHGIPIPHLCAQDGLRPDGNCRACVVEIEGERVLAPSCCRQPTDGMVAHSNNERARKSQRLVVELLKSDMPATAQTLDSELDHWADFLNVTESRFPAREQPAADVSHPAIAVNLDACIRCTRCLRACREEQVNGVIGYASRGDQASIVFDLEDPLGESSCVACGECVQACPTGALMPAGNVGLRPPQTSVDSICPYCGVGCQLTYHVRDNQILHVSGRDGPANQGRLCVKGRYGFDYVRDRGRLTV
ncbi:MAG: 2Fe-2S iron-sulfur cluster-binding protein, partial [Thiohalocapsa sp.]